MAKSNKLDNDHLPSKIGLRVEAVELLGEPRKIRVLDAYHGHGVLWDLTIDALPDGWEVQLYRADQQFRKAGTLKVENSRLLDALDLSKFDLIDLDAYGWPTAQLKTVATKAPNTLVLSTRNSMRLGTTPRMVLKDLGLVFPPDAPETLITKLENELWEAWLYQLGYRRSRLLHFEDKGLVKRYEILMSQGFLDTTATGDATRASDS